MEITPLVNHLSIIMAVGVVLAAYLVDFICCRFIAPLIRRIAKSTSYKWDEYLTRGKILNYLFHLIPPIVFLILTRELSPGDEIWKRLLVKGLEIYLIIVASCLICEFISSLYEYAHDSESLKNKPLKGLYQMFQVIVICLAIILSVGVLINKDFTSLIAALGASAAVLMLIFKDAIMGVMAGVQLSAHDMLRPGDWIMLEKYDINGEVEEVNMNTVKVRNWDNSISTIPPYILISDSFKNWRGMRESDGRRVARALRIDMNSIRFCTPEELSRFENEVWAKGLELNSETVNLKLFRTYIDFKLREMESVNSDLMLMVRQLEPGSEGLPLQLYFFTHLKDWPNHERIASEVMEFVIATLPEFGLRVYQRPSGRDKEVLNFYE